jgi:dynactin-4
MFGGEDDEIGRLDQERGGTGGKGKTVGVLERHANVTVVGGEVVVGRDAKKRMPQYSVASQGNAQRGEGGGRREGVS